MKKLDKHTNQEHVLIFLHIPKAGGSTLHRIIEKQYEPSTIFTIPSFYSSKEEFRQAAEFQLKEIKVLKGHMFFGLPDVLPNPSTYITLLRDPVERIISHYYYVLRTPIHYLYKDVKAKNMSLKEYACSGLSVELDNGQTRLISGFNFLDHSQPASQEMLEVAKQNLKSQFAVVGIVEDFNKTLMLLKKEFGWKMPFYVKENTTKNRLLKERVSKETLDVIKKHNELDIELYRYAKDIFEDLVNQQDASFEREIKVFNLLNGVYQTYRGVYASSRLAALKMMGRC
jgi:hypothetical protein